MKQNEYIKETLPEAEIPIKEHQLSSPTVGKSHNWKQQGGYLNCFSCESPHGFHIGTDKMYMGRNEDGSLNIISK